MAAPSAQFLFIVGLSLCFIHIAKTLSTGGSMVMLGALGILDLLHKCVE